MKRTLCLLFAFALLFVFICSFTCSAADIVYTDIDEFYDACFGGVDLEVGDSLILRYPSFDYDFSNYSTDRNFSWFDVSKIDFSSMPDYIKTILFDCNSVVKEGSTSNNSIICLSCFQVFSDHVDFYVGTNAAFGHYGPKANFSDETTSLHVGFFYVTSYGVYKNFNLYKCSFDTSFNYIDNFSLINSDFVRNGPDTVSYGYTLFDSTDDITCDLYFYGNSFVRASYIESSYTTDSNNIGFLYCREPLTTVRLPDGVRLFSFVPSSSEVEPSEPTEPETEIPVVPPTPSETFPPFTIPDDNILPPEEHGFTSFLFNPSDLIKSSLYVLVLAGVISCFFAFVSVGFRSLLRSSKGGEIL